MSSAIATAEPVEDAPRYRRLSSTIHHWVEPNERRLELALYAVVAVAGWWVRMVQDDAFISFRYARNLAEGHGLVFNPGERVEGYTNFLWTLLMWVPEELGWNTASVSQFVTLPLMVGTVAVALRLARRVLGDPTLALMAAAALGANMTFLAYGTSGLETMLQTFLLTSFALLLLPLPDRVPMVGRRVAAGVVGALAVLTRIDSVVLVATWVAIHLWAMRPAGDRADAGWRPALTAAATIAAPAVVLIAPWLIWKSGYYGELLPNTLAAKSAGNPLVALAYGLFVVVGFFASYFAFLLIGRWRRTRHDYLALPATRTALVAVAPWLAYICIVGGDFMEYRFMVPVLPLLAMPAAFLLDHVRTPRRHVALVGLLLLVSVGHRLAPAESPIWPVMSFENLKRWPDDSPNSFVAMGETLREAFPGGVAAPDQVTIGVSPAGVIPYVAELPTIDMLGLNDRETARDGWLIPLYYPGHVRTSKVDYLVRRDVNLLIGAPQLVKPDPDRSSYRLSQLTVLAPGADLDALPVTAKVLEIPLVEGVHHWQVLYVVPHPAVDAAIERYGWKVLEIDRRCDPDDVIPLMRTFARRTCPEL